ncbi:DUF2087 domain-containing protein [Bacillus shivajii]|uniref:DUF2087 domain-containing protein n=1 Tax=Bacillus shivajii TaxID=1983719 RepID=UPI001CF9BFEC|nr:DUF2087 domain-containing protein [Bacillus shivajii]UCZ52042.1 DUF2087 domain-containing protein [Bacillus shivajii]
MSEIFTRSLNELKAGFYIEEDTESFQCIHCDYITKQGVIYQREGNFFDANREMKEHIISEHGSPLNPLLQLDKRHSGLNDQQKHILQALYNEKKDDEIAKEMKINSSSTVRQHRFKLREKAKQAKVFLAMMELIEKGNDTESFVDIHKEATMVDDRWALSEEEEQKIMNTYIDDRTGKIKQFPAKEKRKIVILKYLASKLETDREYSERDINDIIKKYYDDFVTIRRYFIEYGFVARHKDGSAYWLT